MSLIKTAIRLLVLLVMAHPGTTYAERVEQACDAERFIPCPSFRTSRTIGEHTPIIDNHMAGFTRSKGQWIITVGYGPPEKCAKVSLLLDMGPIDVVRQYKRVFINGGGAISDSGTFMHKLDDLESALRIMHSSCFVPAPDPQTQKTEAEAKERQALEGEREQQELEDERERLALELALEEERERQELEGERERLALEEEQRRLAQEQQRLEQERERRRLAQKRQRLAQQRRERERQRLAQQRREQERQRAEKRSEEKTRALLGLLKGVAGGLGELKESGNPGMAVLKGLADGLSTPSGMDMGGRSPSSGGSGGGSCEQAKRRVDQRNARTLASLSRNARGMCAVSRGYVQMFQNAQRDLARSGCPASVARMFDQPLAQARQRVRATCM